MSDVQIVSHKREVVRATEKALQKAARMIGGAVEGHAKELCPVDTGLLRNSITFALGGKAPQIEEYQSDTPGKNGEKTRGSYHETFPADSKHETTVYVGTNVEYAPYQELGAPNANVPARPFLRPAFENNQDEIEDIIEKCCKDLD